MSSDRVTVVVPGDAQVVSPVVVASQVMTPLRDIRQPIVLLLDFSGAAIEDADNPGKYWTITPEENEAIQ